MKPLLGWAGGIGALAIAYSVFDLPGLLIGLFVGAVIVSASRWKARQRQRHSLSSIEIDGICIDFTSMTMTSGEEIYTLRRAENGKWERHATSLPAINAAVARRKERFSDEDHAASLNKAEELVLQSSSGDRDATVTAKEMSHILRSLPPWSAGRKSIRDDLERYIHECVEKGFPSQRRFRTPGVKPVEMARGGGVMTSNGGNGGANRRGTRCFSTRGHTAP
ncbi:MAG TPA: hypothetical protein VFG23_20375, partial [Polyangia bacterium]|nr:hypothetical protein [Polyangia bacterium]